MRVPSVGEREGLEAVGGGVAEIDPSSDDAEEARPDFVSAGLEVAEGSVCFESWKNDRSVFAKYGIPAGKNASERNAVWP